MLEIQVNASLVPHLPAQLPSLKQGLSLNRWQAHRFDIDQHHCVILREAQTGYAMLFFNLKHDDYQALSEVCRFRLLSEALTVADLDELGNQRLQKNLLEQCQSVLLTQPSSCSQQQLQHLEALVKALVVRHQGIPGNQVEEFRWGVILNDYVEAGLGETPYLQMQQYWQGLAEWQSQASAPLYH